MPKKRWGNNSKKENWRQIGSFLSNLPEIN